MKINQLSIKKILAFNIVLLICLTIVIPIFLDLIEFNIRINIIAFLGNYIIFVLIALMICDVIFLVVKKQNYYFFSVLNMSLSVILFILMMYSFLTQIYEIVYVMNYSNTTLPVAYKIVAIWAGEDGSIMTWMVFNSIIINLFRIKNQKKEDLVFIRAIIMSLIISIFFVFILFYMNPFEVQTPPTYPNGLGLNPLLISPFMIWHPLFTFIGYAIFLIPFTKAIAEITKKNSKLLNSYQEDFYKFSLKFGWLVLSLSIGLGAYWAKIALAPWNRYWGWDPVETVSLLPWLFATAYFHTMSFQKKNKLLVQINVCLIFLSILFSTLITRGGGLNSLHTFAGGAELIVWVILIGIILVASTLYVIYIILDYLLDEYKKKKLFFDYLSYIFLFGMAFVCVFGLFIPPFTFMLSGYFPINTIWIGLDYYRVSMLFLAAGLAISLIFCSLWQIYQIKWIAMAIIIAIIIQSIFSAILQLGFGIWLNPVIIIYFIALFSSFLKLGQNLSIKKGVKHFFRVNSKTIIHVGISFILVGTSTDPNAGLILDFLYITGFIFLMVGIIPSILIAFFPKINIKEKEYIEEVIK
ncbi:hypothetical protein LCGC14_0707240 [marine sediment metagenome]|uniref:Cytochrome c assembly protein domain-containing protein n=1 Tax=marine sediment metagenome TaxID=412755 RepID=A0A0F9QKQ0_9ZZZZ|nr:MAG: Cytochrome c-type biogenesis protein CcmF [Candidatus Lokiarchaeum sp. GC14_75]